MPQFLSKRGGFLSRKRHEVIFRDHPSFSKKSLIDMIDVGVESANDFYVEKIAKETIGELKDG